MDITFSCTYCGQRVVVDEAGAGITVQCPECGLSLTVPQVQPVPPKPPTPSTDSPPIIPQSIPAIPVRRRMLRKQIAMLVIACALAFVGLMALSVWMDKGEQAGEKARSRIFTAQYLKDSGGFLGGSIWMVESAENNDGTKGNGGYAIYVWPSPHALYKGDGLVTGDRITFRAVFNGYERMESPNGSTTRIESWRPIDQ